MSAFGLISFGKVTFKNKYLKITIDNQIWPCNSDSVYAAYVLNSHYRLPLQLMTQVWWHYRWLSVTRSSPTQLCLSTRPALFLHCHHLSTTGCRWMVRLCSVLRWLCHLAITLSVWFLSFFFSFLPYPITSLCDSSFLSLSSLPISNSSLILTLSGYPNLLLPC